MIFCRRCSISCSVSCADRELFSFQTRRRVCSRAVITFESAYFLFIHTQFHPSYSVKRSRGSKAPPRLSSNILLNVQPFTHTRPRCRRVEDREYKRAGLDVVVSGRCLKVNLLCFRLVDLHHRSRMYLAARTEDGGSAHHQCGHEFTGNASVQLPFFILSLPPLRHLCTVPPR